MLLPPLCPLCRQPLPTGPEGAPLCSSCSAGLRELQEPFCTVCAVPFAGDGPSHPCPRCLGDRVPFTALRAWGLYRGGLLDAIHSLKYRGNLGARAALETFLLAGYDRWWPPGAFSAVVPVPCHPSTLRRRGFDLPALLSRRLARARGLPWAPTALAKARATPDLVGLRPAERRLAVAGAYAARRRLEGDVLLVDDVATSTATARACAAACLEAGAERVHVLVLARTPLEGS